VHVAWRKDLERLLTTFVAEHPGLRSGRMFGVPGAYAGRKLFACVFEDGITAKLPPDAFEAAIRQGARRWTPQGRRLRGWVIFRPQSLGAAARLGPFLEISARHVAELSVAAPSRRRARVSAVASCEGGRPR